jgi:hypothetical protein
MILLPCGEKRANKQSRASPCGGRRRRTSRAGPPPSGETKGNKQGRASPFGGRPAENRAEPLPRLAGKRKKGTAFAVPIKHFPRSERFYASIEITGADSC